MWSMQEIVAWSKGRTGALPTSPLKYFGGIFVIQEISRCAVHPCYTMYQFFGKTSTSEPFGNFLNNLDVMEQLDVSVVPYIVYVSMLHFYGWVVFHCIDIPHFLYPFNSW